MKFPKWFNFLILIYFSIWLKFANTIPSGNITSRLATIQSLVENKTFAIDQSFYISTIDKVRIGSHYYSDKPPLLSIIGSCVYSVLHFFGITFTDHPEITILALNFFLVFLPSLIILLLSHWYSMKKQDKPLLHFLRVSIPVFCTLALPYSTAINNHLPAATGLFAAWVLYQLDDRRYFKWILISLTFSISFDLASGFVALPLLAILLFRSFKNFRHALIVLLAFIPILLTFFAYYHISGKWTPLAMQTEAFLYPGTPWSKEYLVGGTLGDSFDLKPILNHFLHGTLGFKGAFSHSLILIPGIVVLINKAKKKSVKSIGILFGVIASFLFFSLEGSFSFGGACYGYRYLIFWMPLVAFESVEFFKNQKRTNAMIAVAIFSFITSAQGLIDPFMAQPWNQLGIDNFDFIRIHNRANSFQKIDHEKIMNLGQQLYPLLLRNDSEANLNKARLLLSQDLPSESFRYLAQYERSTGIEKIQNNVHCYRAWIFSEKGINLPDLMEKEKTDCDPKIWAELNGS